MYCGILRNTHGPAWSSLVQAMDCPLLCAKSLPEPMLTYWIRQISSEGTMKRNDLHSIKCTWKCRLQHIHIVLTLSCELFVGIWNVSASCLSQWHHMSIMVAPISSHLTVCSATCLTDPLWGESTGNRWIPLTKGQWWRQHFYVISPSCDGEVWL